MAKEITAAETRAKKAAAAERLHAAFTSEQAEITEALQEIDTGDLELHKVITDGDGVITGLKGKTRYAVIEMPRSGIEVSSPPPAEMGQGVVRQSVLIVYVKKSGTAKP